MEPTLKTSPDSMISDYANSILIEATAWDAKILFGEYSERSKSVEFHTSITIPWAQAKLFGYYLQANILAHETVNGGAIKIPAGALPQELPLPQDANSKRIFEVLNPLREQFFASLGS